MTNAMNVTANGRTFEVEGGTTIDAFIRSRDLDPRFVIVELNGEPLERERYGEVVFTDGDRVELVRAVAGLRTWAKAHPPRLPL